MKFFVSTRVLGAFVSAAVVSLSTPQAHAEECSTLMDDPECAMPGATCVEEEVECEETADVMEQDGCLLDAMESCGPTPAPSGRRRRKVRRESATPPAPAPAPTDTSSLPHTPIDTHLGGPQKIGDPTSDALLGSGAHSHVYDLGDGNIIKLLKDPDDESERDRLLEQVAHANALASNPALVDAQGDPLIQHVEQLVEQDGRIVGLIEPLVPGVALGDVAPLLTPAEMDHIEATLRDYKELFDEHGRPFGDWNVWNVLVVLDGPEGPEVHLVDPDLANSEFGELGSPEAQREDDTLFEGTIAMMHDIHENGDNWSW